MIPKTIHYCWFGGNPLPKLAKKCIRSWKKYCKDYEIREWNERNFDLASAPLYVRQAYEAKKWAFVTDYVRLQIVHEHGGIYLDTDVELKKSLTPLLENKAYFGFEDGKYINTGLGFGAEKGTPILKELMADYERIPFLLPDGSPDITSCPIRNTEVFLRHGLKQDDSCQILDGSILILPSIMLCPMSYNMREKDGFENAYSIHWFSASWYEKAHREQRDAWLREVRKDKRRHLPNRILMKLLGADRYEKLKRFIKSIIGCVHK